MANQTDNPFNFSAKLDELDKITGALDGDVDLDEGIKQYDRGMKLIQELRTYLSEQTNRVEEIKQAYGAVPREPDDATMDELESGGTVDVDTIPF